MRLTFAPFRQVFGVVAIAAFVIVVISGWLLFRGARAEANAAAPAGGAPAAGTAVPRPSDVTLHYHNVAYVVTNPGDCGKLPVDEYYSTFCRALMSDSWHAINARNDGPSAEMTAILALVSLTRDTRACDDPNILAYIEHGFKTDVDTAHATCLNTIDLFYKRGGMYVQDPTNNRDGEPLRVVAP